MAVIHGSQSDAFMNGFDVGLFFNSVKSSHSKEVLEKTVLNNDGAKTYHAGHKAGKVSASGFFDAVDTVWNDPDAGDTMMASAIEEMSTESVFCHFPQGAGTVGYRGVGFSGILTSYDIDTSEAALGAASLELESTVGREKVLVHHVLAAVTNSLTGTSVDNGASSANGGAGYVHCTVHTSGTLPLLIQHSTDDSIWSTLVTFTNITADRTSERVAVTGTVNRYTRAYASGTFVATFMAAFHRKP